ncbi:MAG: type 4a pilus biogenesis protein PilO [Gammaproteobacteria bacterium]|nr:type 4a pilus biogenesis protein PilO [Gammaproteobacteria bacterium]MCW8910253.1 type 4a pilus biogenesis protein PilO [Gammaproteobacteria bacterium]MCW9004033.1 type 4a pilus biogenesis protein PilO [Gammaproteobacteria bacterium]MCW9055886.1 type 4a pilus biogenesis protein PilO [Gammaproteobacteria bacterium]
MDIKELVEKINEFDLSQIDVNDLKKIGSAPTPVKIIVIALVCVVVAGLGIWQDTTKQLDVLETARTEESTLKKTFNQKQSKAANLDAYSQQLEEMKRSFGALLRQLPNKTEIESLLTDISQTGIASGLEIEFFKPEGLSPKEFYAEFPIKLRVTGRFHQFGKFVSGVAALPRIVTMRDIIIKHPDDQGGVRLVMEVTAVTYQYLDEQEGV